MKVKKKFKNETERKNYCTKVLKLTLKKDPAKGRLCVPVLQDTLMKTGLRISAERTKKETFDDKQESREAFQKASEGVRVSTNDKVGSVKMEGPAHSHSRTFV